MASSWAAVARRAPMLWLVCVLLAAIVTARTTYVADLSAFLPSTPTAEQAVLLDQLHSGVGARLMLLGIEGGTAEARSKVSLEWGQTLRKSGLFDSVNNGDNSQYEAFGRFLFEHRYLLSPAVDAQRFTTDGLRDGIADTVGLLGTPAGALVKSVILRDPTGETIRMGESMLPNDGPRSEGGVWVSRTAPRAVLLATTHADGSDLDAQQQTIDTVRASFAPYASQGLKLLVSGAGTFAVTSRTQIKSEVERLAIAGSVAVVALLLLSFGSLKTLLIALLPVASGVLAGIAVVSLGFGHVHGITLGFGTTLIGEAVDYAIYYLIQSRPLSPTEPAGSGSRRWILQSWPTVRLGLWTSICGFAALIFSGFPGLAQLGVFSIAGLTAAALTTRYVFPVFAPDGAPGQGLRRQLGRLTGWFARVMPRLRSPLLLLALASVAVLVFGTSPWRGTLSSLSPVGAAAMKIDADLRNDVGSTEDGTLVALPAPDEAGALAKAEAAGQRLDKLVASGVLQGYDSPARLLPSIATQTARRNALPEAAELRTRLAEATVDGPLNASRLGGFVDDVQAARSQPLLTRASLQGTPLATVLDALLVPGAADRPWRALISLHTGGKTVDAAALRQALADVPGAQVVNIGGELGSLYARYLHEAGLQALLGALAVCALLALHLRSGRRLLLVIQPIAASVVIVMAGLALVGAPLGILHLVGFLLMVAIGSNYALFFDYLRHVGSVDLDTLASLALANLTAVISFCLLAVSSIPALYAIGQVVAPGVLLCLLLSAAFNGPARGGAKVDNQGYGKIA